MSSSRKNENWLLVQWSSGGRDVVHVRSVVDPMIKELKIGDTLTLNRRGKQETATLIARARERNMLEAMLVKKEAVAGPSGQGKEDEEGEDFSSSASDWVPSDNDAQSCDSDTGVTAKKIKLEHYKRQYSRSNRKTMTPSNRANAVPVNITNRKRTYGPLNLSKNKSLPDSTKQNQSLGQKVTININELTQINNTFITLFKMIKEMKAQLSPVVNVNSAKEHTERVAPSLKIEENMQYSYNLANYSMDESKENDNDISENEDFNTSDDNVLISNKYSHVGVTTVARKVPENEEWIPIGSGKTLIHKDKYKKINWKSYTIATRTLLLAVFPRRVLATHSLTGKQSPAFQNKPAKMCLDQKIISDVIIEVMDRFDVRENLVRSIITTKCADECKMWKTRNNKKKTYKKKENVTPQPVQ